jgi:hexokinase
MKPAVSGKKKPGPQVGIQIVPKPPVKDEFPDAIIAELEEWIDTAEVPPAPNGATVLTKIDTTTGETSNQIEMKPPPWFALERGNTLGAGYEIGSQGTKIPLYYRRDILRVKDVHLIGEIGGKIALDPAEKSEGHAAALVEFRF